MKCKNCGARIAADDCFCASCGSEIEASSSKKFIIILTSIALVMVLAITGILFFTHKDEPDFDPVFSQGVESADLESEYEVSDGTIDLSELDPVYTTGEEACWDDCTVYIDDQECEINEGQVCIPPDITQEQCTLRVEWVEDGESYSCESPITLSYPQGVDFEEIKAELIDEYGESEVVVGDSNYLNEDTELYGDIPADGKQYKYYETPGIAEFSQLDMNGDGRDELFCFIITEENSLDCLIYSDVNGSAECVYCLSDNGEEIQEGYGGLSLRTGDVPHLTNLNRMTPMCIYCMDGGTVTRHDFPENPDQYDDLCMADLYGVVYEEYNEYIGGEDNFEELIMIYGEMDTFYSEVKEN